MILTKRNVSKIPLKVRHYNSQLYNNKFIEELFVGELDTFENIQIFRVFRVVNFRCHEIQRFYYDENGNVLIMSYGSFFNRYAYSLDYSTKFIFRKFCRVHYYVHKLIIKNVLPSLKNYIKPYLAKETDIYEYLLFVLKCKSNYKLESIACINYKLFIDIFNNTSYNYQFINIIEKNFRQFQLIAKWNYKISSGAYGWNTRMYLDYLDLLRYFGKDLHSPKYLCPKNLRKEHDKLVEKKEGAIILEDDRLSYAIKMNKYKLFEFKCSSDNFIIKPLLTIDDVRKEGAVQSHCVFKNEYYKDENSLLFTSFYKGKKLETIEYSIEKKKVIQCLGYKNECTEYHDQILDLANTYITNYLFN